MAFSRAFRRQTAGGVTLLARAVVTFARNALRFAFLGAVGAIGRKRIQNLLAIATNSIFRAQKGGSSPAGASCPTPRPTPSPAPRLSPGGRALDCAKLARVEH